MTAVPHIFVPQPIREEAVEKLHEVGRVEMAAMDRMLSFDETITGLSRADYVLAIGNWGIGAEALQHGTHLRGIGCAYEEPEIYGVDVQAATKLGIPVTRIHNTHAYADGTAELTIAFVAALAWRIPEADMYTRADLFRQCQSVMFTTPGWKGKTLGLLGLGKVGRRVAEMSRGLGMTVLYTKRERLAEDEEEALGIVWVPSIIEVMENADFVSLHIDHRAETEGIIGSREFAHMKRSAYFINTARARVTDEEALIDALIHDRIAGAALDVFYGEPPFSPFTLRPLPDRRLRELKNVLLAPHMGGRSERALNELAGDAAENIVAMVKGEVPPGLINPEAYAVVPRSEFSGRKNKH